MDLSNFMSDIEVKAHTTKIEQEIIYKIKVLAITYTVKIIIRDGNIASISLDGKKRMNDVNEEHIWLSESQYRALKLAMEHHEQFSERPEELDDSELRK